MPIRTYRIDEELDEGIARAASARGISRTVVVREALAQYLAAPARNPPERLVQLADRLATHPGSGVSDLGTKSEEHLRAKLGSRRRTSDGRRRPR
jgi:hypothetical protein